MKINQQGGEMNQSGVSISSDIKRESEMLDKQGNVIDPRTKQIIKKNNESIL